MVSRHINPSSYFLMNIDRITDNESHQKINKKKTIFNSLKPDNYNRQNLFIDEANSAVNNRYFMNNTNNSLTVTSNLNQIRQEGFVTNVNRLNANHQNINNNNNNQMESNRCAICHII
jgi:hypothetical protein